MRLTIQDNEGRVVFDTDDDPEFWAETSYEDKTKILTLISRVMKFLLGLKPA